MKKTLVALLVASAIAFIPGCKSFDSSAKKTTKNAYVVVAAVENGFAGKCIGSKKDYTKMCARLKPYAKTQVKLLDKTATRSAILGYMAEGVKNDLFIFYFSGHGMSAPTYSDASEVDGKDEYIMAYDAAISDNEIWSIISTSRGRVVLIFDCCHAQTMFKTCITFAKQRNMMKATHYEAGPISMICWSGCSDDKSSYGTTAGGLFTKALYSAFSKNKSYDQVWAKVENNSTLKKTQAVQCTKMGWDFGSLKIFQ